MDGIPDIHLAFDVGEEAGDLPFEKANLLIVFGGPGAYPGAEAYGPERKSAGLLQLPAA
jgi:hypothetical protein